MVVRAYEVGSIAWRANAMLEYSGALVDARVLLPRRSSRLSILPNPPASGHVRCHNGSQQ